MTDNLTDLVRLLKRAEIREREAHRDETAALLGQMFEDVNQKMMRNNFGNASDRAREEAETMVAAARHSDLEMKRMLGEPLSDEEEAERLDLAARRNSFGTYLREAPEASE